MANEKTKFTVAVELLEKLMTESVIRNNREDKSLYTSYFDTDVKSHLDIMTEGLGFTTFSVNDKIYMFATPDSNFSQTNADMRSKIIGVNKNSQVYLADIIFIIFLSEIFSGSNAMQLKRQFIPIDELITATKTVFDNIKDKERINEDTDINFLAAKQEWENLAIEPINKSNPTSKDRVGFITNVMQFFHNEGLVEKISETCNILLYPTTKLKDFVSASVFDIERFNSILESI
jgi:hypothetical protein